MISSNEPSSTSADASAAFLYLVAPERVTSGEAFAAQAGEALFGPAGALFFTCVVVVAVLGSLAAFACLFAFGYSLAALAAPGLADNVRAAVERQARP